MTDTINNVPRELLERVLYLMDNYIGTTHTEEDELRALLSAPSPAGVDGLKRYEVFPYLDDEVAELDICESDDGMFVKYDDAQAIIDGLRGEVAEQEETANQWRELALQFDRHRMTAMAHIRAAASGDKSAIEALGVFAALPPIPGHEITAERDRQAQRIGELEGLLRHAQKQVPTGSGLHMRIDDALSAVCAPRSTPPCLPARRGSYDTAENTWAC